MMKRAVRILVLVLALLALTQVAFAGTATAPLHVSVTVLPKGRVSSGPDLSSARFGTGSTAMGESATSSVSVSGTKGISYRVFLAGPAADAGAQDESGRPSHVTVEW